MSNSLQPHVLQFIRFLCPPPFSGVCSDSCPLSWWCYLTVLSSATPFSFCLQSFPSSESFPTSGSLYQVAEVLHLSFSISFSNEYSGLISFQIDWFDLLVVQATLKILLKQHSLKASFLRHSAFFMVQLLHLYITTGKAVALTIWTSVGKVLSAF